MTELTPAERQVALLIGAGFTNKQIAQILGKTPKTVKNQVNAIYGKDVAVNRNELRARYRAGRQGEAYGPQDYQSARP